MASLYFDEGGRGKWRCKWRSRGPDGRSRWMTVTLCHHPGWSPGKPKPKRPTAEALQLFAVYQDQEIKATHGLEVAPVRATPLREFIESFVQRESPGWADSTLRITQYVTRGFLAWCARNGVESVADVTVTVCRDYLGHLASTSLSWATVAASKRRLSPIWSAALEERRVAENPWRFAKVPGKPRDERPPFWTEDEVKRLLAVCLPWLREIVIVGVNSGLRISALLALEWRDIEWAKDTIHVRAVNSKGAKPYDAPLLEQARDVLQRRWVSLKGEASATEFVFGVGRNGRRQSSNRTYQAIERATHQSGITDHGHYNHILRHTFATWAVSRGVPIKVVSTWLGHASISMTERYAHADPREHQRWAEFFSRGGILGNAPREANGPS